MDVKESVREPRRRRRRWSDVTTASSRDMRNLNVDENSGKSASGNAMDRSKKTGLNGIVNCILFFNSIV